MEKDLFLVEGIRHVGEAIEAGCEVDSLYYAPDLLKSEFALRLVQTSSDAGVPVVATTADVFYSIAERENPQGILAAIRKKEFLIGELNPANFLWGVALLSPQDPGNLGSILRTIDAVGASGLIILESSVDAYHPSAIRAGMGVHFWYPIVHSDYSEFSQWVKRHHYHVYGTTAHAKKTKDSVVNYEQPAILLMGSEREGLSEPYLELCELLIRIPMRGRSSSLNLAVATGILLYDMLTKGINN